MSAITSMLLPSIKVFDSGAYLVLALWVIGAVAVGGLMFMISFLVLISITEFQFETGFQMTLSRRSRPASDRGIVAQAEIQKPLEPIANAPEPAVKGGTLAGHPIALPFDTEAGEGGVMALYPPNKIHVRCSNCDAPIPRYTGYKHALIGVRRVVCAECQAKLGLPLREPETYANLRDN